MPAWITTYLRDPPANLTPNTIATGIGAVDWLTLGEIFDLEEDQVKAFMDQLLWTDIPLGFTVEPNQRHVQIHVWVDPDRVRMEIDELQQREGLVLPATVHNHLMNVRGVVAIELGWPQLRTMYEIVAFEIAYWLAEIGAGVILSPDDYWFDHDVNRYEPISDPV